MSSSNGTHPLAALHLDAEGLRPLVQEIVAEVLTQLRDIEAQTNRDDGRLAYSEPEAARMLGLQSHQLRDERLRGRIAASSIVGRRVRYVVEDLRRYLAERRQQAG